MSENSALEKTIGKTIIAKVIGTKMDKTIKVGIEEKVKHKLYGKYVKRFRRMYAHDEKNQCKVGDVVEIREVRPLSKTKNWALVQIIKSIEK